MIVLCRHGQTEWNLNLRLQGWRDSPLTALGIQQAEQLVGFLATIPDGRDFSITCSPLGRAQQTAKIVSTRLENDITVTTDNRLKEYSFGHWEGLTLTQVQQRYPQQWRARLADKWNYQIPDGESYALLSHRTCDWLHSLTNDHYTVAICHEMTAKTIRGAYLGLSQQQTMALSQTNGTVIVLAGGHEKQLCTTHDE